MDTNVIQLGLVRAAGLDTVLEEERKAAEQVQNTVFVQSLAGHVKKCWQQARDAKRMMIEPRLLQSIRARRAEYDPEKLAQIRAQGGSEVYAALTGTKCRAAASWIRDVMMSSGTARPWLIKPTPIPTLPPEINDMIVGKAMKPIKQSILAGMPMPQEQVLTMMSNLKDQALGALRDEAGKRAERMADKMEDQLTEGGFPDALDQFIDDIVTFPCAVLKGPVVRRKPRLQWSRSVDGTLECDVQDELVLEWERVSPFAIYPSPAAVTVDDGFLIEKHTLERRDLNELIGVDGYDDAAIRKVLDEYSHGGLREWLANDVAQASAEGKATTAVSQNPEGTIDALQFWGTVPGKWLVEWGMSAKEVQDQTREYQIEAWLIGNYVIKATLNVDPLGRKPYYKASYEDVPGSWWGNSVADLVRDTQQIVNAAARAIVNNMGMASGPQVTVNVSRLAHGEEISTLQPWRIWQVTDDGLNGGAQQPVGFFQPQSNVNELMAVFEKFSQMADEYSGIPRYLTGDTTGGAGRTASGLSMLINNAGKSIKQVIGNIDMNVMKPMLERLYFHNMLYADDPELKGDVAIVARGANALVAKEAAQVRRNEFLATTANPIDMQIVGIEGRAALLRETAKNLDMNPDQIVPPIEVLRQKWQAQQMMAAQMAPQQGSLPSPSSSGQNLADGAPVTDNFSPPSGVDS